MTGLLKVDFEKRLGDFHLRPSFESAGELVVLFGPSGAGKSLTLRSIAGLMKPDSGRIELPQGVAFDAAAGINLPPQQRGVGYVVQDLALFPHLSVAQNLAFPLDGWSREARLSRIAELVDLLGIEGLETRKPAQISGGQQQRVALGRALAAKPGLLLLDEPFSSLDGPTRSTLRREVARLQRQLGLQIIFVTHDLDEAFSLADSMAVYDAGCVLQFGSRDNVLRHPASSRVATLLDARNIVPCTVTSIQSGVAEVETSWFGARGQAGSGLETADRCVVCIRPEHVVLHAEEPGNAGEMPTVIEAEITEEDVSATSHRLYLRVISGAPGELVIEADISDVLYEQLGVASRKRWWLGLPLSRTVVIPA